MNMNSSKYIKPFLFSTLFPIMPLAATPVAAKSFPAPSCDRKALTEVVASYDFSGKLNNNFVNSSAWPSDSASLQQRNQQLEFDSPRGTGSTDANEAWVPWKKQLSASKSWKIQADLSLPARWNSGKDEDQVGVGLFVGKPKSRGVSATVYEVDFIAIANGPRAVLAQNIKNRLGGDPNYVHKEVSRDLTSINLEIMYCHDDQSLSVYYNGDNRVDTQPVAKGGLFNWKIGAFFDVGIMGFSEGPDVADKYPSIDNWKIFEAPSGIN